VQIHDEDNVKRSGWDLPKQVLQGAGT